MIRLCAPHRIHRLGLSLFGLTSPPGGTFEHCPVLFSFPSSSRTLSPVSGLRVYCVGCRVYAVLEQRGFHLQTLIIYKLGCNQNCYTFTLILLMKIVMCSKFPCTKFINYKCFDMRFRRQTSRHTPPSHAPRRSTASASTAHRLAAPQHSGHPTRCRISRP